VPIELARLFSICPTEQVRGWSSDRAFFGGIIRQRFCRSIEAKIGLGGVKNGEISGNLKNYIKNICKKHPGAYN
jgi:hypothetical protein